MTTYSHVVRDIYGAQTGTCWHHIQIPVAADDSQISLSAAAVMLPAIRTVYHIMWFAFNHSISNECSRFILACLFCLLLILDYPH